MFQEEFGHYKINCPVTGHTILKTINLVLPSSGFFKVFYLNTLKSLNLESKLTVHNLIKQQFHK
jgi:hypothetical protein